MKKLILLGLLFLFIPFSLADINQGVHPNIISIPLSQIAVSMTNFSSLDHNRDGYFDRMHVRSISDENNALRIMDSSSKDIFLVDTINKKAIIGQSPFSSTPFTMQVKGHLGPDEDDVYDLGNSDFKWRNMYVGTIYGNASGVILPDGFIQGGVVFADSNGALDQNVPNFFWDDNNNRLGIGTNNPSSSLHVLNGALLASGTTGATPVSGAGTRMMWIPEKGAFRAGTVVGTEWDDVNIGMNSFASGLRTTASGDYSTAMGGVSTASGNYSVALGRQASASGEESIALGNSIASGFRSVALGVSSATGDHSFAVINSIASGSSSIALGNSFASGSQSISLGQWVSSTADNSIVLGKGVNPGSGLTNNIANSLMVGFDSTTPTLFVNGSAVGIGTTTPGAKLDVEVVSGGAATIGHSSNVATGDYAVAIGKNAEATGSGSFAHGYEILGFGKKIISEGQGSIAMGNVALGDIISNGTGSVAMGIGSSSDLISSDTGSVALGSSVKATGTGSVALGSDTLASGTYSFASGDRTVASNDGSTAMGRQTTASGIYSTAMGVSTTASGDYSFSIGKGVNSESRLVNNIANSLMIGFDSTTPTLFVDGNRIGVSTSTPGTSYNLDVVGNLRLRGSSGLYFGGTGNDDADVQLFRGAANRLDLASGDSFNIISGNLMTDSNNINVITTSNVPTGLRANGLLLGSSLDSIPLTNEIRTTLNQNLILNSRGTGQINFQTQDSTKMILANNGSLGIGVTPTHKLDVNGNLRLRGNRIYDENNIQRLQIGSTNYISGNLDLNGNLFLHGDIVQDSGNFYNVSTLNLNGSLNVPITTTLAGGVDGDSENRLLISSSGRISRPGSADNSRVYIEDDFQVQDISYLGNIRVNTNTIDTTTGDINIDSHSNIINIAPGTSAKTVNIATASSNANNINIGSGTVANNIIIGSNTGAASTIIRSGTGDITLSSTDQIKLISSKSSGGTTNEAIGLKSSSNLGASDELLQVGDSAGDYLTIMGSGNIGIKTSSPNNFDLQVAGNVGPNANNTYDLGSSALRWRSLYVDTIYGESTGVISPDGFTQGGVVFADPSGSLAQDVPNFFWDDNNNRLGIGTNSPLNDLHVNGGIRVIDLTANRIVATNSNKDLVSTITAANLLSSVTGTTGSGNLVFSINPTINTSIVSGTTSFDLINSVASTVNFAGAATSLNMGATSGTVTIRNPNIIFSADSTLLNFTSSTGTKTISTGGTTHLNLNPGGNVGIGTTTPNAKFHIVNGALLASGTTGATPVSGAGTRMMWIPEKGAFRAGTVVGTEWDNVNIGMNSFASGLRTTASGDYSTAMGGVSTASGNYSVALGRQASASGEESIALGNSIASGFRSVALGVSSATGDHSFAVINSIASGSSSIALGNSFASGSQSISLGQWVSSTADNSIVLGKGVNPGSGLTNNIANSLMIGFDSTTPTLFVNGSAVGVSTSTPSVTLDVRTTDAIRVPVGTSAQRPSAETGLIRYNTETQTFEGYGSAWGSLGGVMDVDQDTYISAEDFPGADNDELKFFTAGIQRMIIDSNGNVGINTLSPDFKLDVNGTGRFTGALTLGTQATTTAHAVRADRSLTMTGTANQVNINIETAQDLTSDRSWTFSLPQNIHTDATPTFSRLITTSTADNALELSGNTAGITFSSSSSGTNQIITAGNSDLALMPHGTGNVGIGTSSPSFKLDVSGTGRFTDALTLGTQATTTAHAVRADRSLTITTNLPLTGTATQDLTSNREWTLGIETADLILGTNTNGLSFTGTNTNRLTGTGNLQINLPQRIDTSASPSFSTLTLTNGVSNALLLSGNGAGISFSGTGNHDIVASSGTLRLGATTLTGTITGNSQIISNLGQLTVDNLRLDGNTLDTTSGNLILDSNGGNVQINDNLQVSGVSTFNDNVFINADLFLQGNLTRVNVQEIDVNGSILPAFDNQYDLGSTSLRWRNGYFYDLDVIGDINVTGGVSFEDLTANRIVATDENKNLVSTISAANLLSSVTGTTGTGSLVFANAPYFYNSINSNTETFNLINLDASTVNFAGDASELNMGASSGTATIRNPNIIFSADSTLLNFASSTGTKTISTGGKTHLNLNPGGNVGIGTSSPSYKLDISGTGRFTEALTLGTQASTTAHAVRADRRLMMEGTTNQISISAGTQDLTSDRSWTFSLPQNIHTDATPTFSRLITTSTADNALELSGNTAGITFSSSSSGTNQIISAGNSDLALMPHGTGNVGIGTTSPNAKLQVSGNVSTTGTVLIGTKTPGNRINPSATGNDADLYVSNNIQFGNRMYGPGADVAENYPSVQKLEPGDVVIADINNPGHIVKSIEAKDTKVLGIISTDPSILLNIEEEGYALALSGKVPVKVTNENGEIRIGDLLTTSSKEGYAMKCVSQCTGAIVAKALDNLNEKEGIIEVLVMLG